jgi:hypothetical protein
MTYACLCINIMTIAIKRLLFINYPFPFKSLWLESFMNCSDCVVFLNCSDCMVFLNCSDCVVFKNYSDCGILEYYTVWTEYLFIYVCRYLLIKLQSRLTSCHVTNPVQKLIIVVVNIKYIVHIYLFVFNVCFKSSQELVLLCSIYFTDSDYPFGIFKLFLFMYRL